MRPDLKFLFEPKRVVMIGASGLKGEDEIYSTHFFLVKERLPSFKGKVHIVDVQGKLAGGESLSAIKKDALTIILLPPQLLDKNIKKILQKSTCVVLLSRGGDKSAQMLSSFSKRGVVVGPASFGVVNTSNGLIATISGNFQRGKVAVVSDDPLLAEMAAEKAGESGAGVSKFVCMGELGLQLMQMLEFLRQDKETEIICLVLKNIPTRKDIDFIKIVSSGKPVLVISARVEEKIFVSAVKQAGGILAESLEEMFNGARMLVGGRPMRGRRVAVVTNSKSAGLLAEKWIEKSGMTLAAVPPEVFEKSGKSFSIDGFVDIGEEAGGEDYRRVVDRLSEEKEIDGLLVLAATGLGKLGEGDLQKIVERCEKSKEKPAVLVALGAKSEAIAAISRWRTPIFSNIQSAVAALKISALRKEIELRSPSR
ncbi:MAG: hypothetical protein ACK4GQ_03650 [Candidatus Hadarchaeales archaeon]